MQPIVPPSHSASDVYLTCISTVASRSKAAFRAGLTDVQAADLAFRAAAQGATSSVLDSSDFDVSGVPSKQMAWLYDKKFAAKSSPGRRIYDELKTSSRLGRCPLCGFRDATTLDHYLPKSRFAALAVNPINLVPACTECNTTKRSSVVETLHPYFDDISQDAWLTAEVEQVSPAAIVYSVATPATWPSELAQRVNTHFEFFELDKLYTAQAARALSGTWRMLDTLYTDEGSGGVQDYLAGMAVSWSRFDPNAWEAAMYTAVANSPWFCCGGYRP